MKMTDPPLFKPRFLLFLTNRKDIEACLFMNKITAVIAWSKRRQEKEETLTHAPVIRNTQKKTKEIDELSSKRDGK